MSHRSAQDLFTSNAVMLDEGNGATITVDRSPAVIELVSAGAETRTLARSTRSGAIIVIGARTIVGTVTLTVTGGYNEDGDTTFAFTEAGQFAVFQAFKIGSDITWRKLTDYQTGNVTAAELGYLSGVTAGTGAASKAVVLDANGDVVMPSGGVFSFGRATLAAAGTTAADAAVLTQQFQVVTGADEAKGVALPAAATAEGPYWIYNDAAAGLFVYPVNGGNDNINALAEDAGFLVAGGEVAVFVPTSATQWYVSTFSALGKPRALDKETVANAGTISAANMRGGLLFQDASGGNVTMTTRTGTQMSADFPEFRVGDTMLVHHYGNHASNTSTVAGGTDVTLIGSGAVTTTGGTYLLRKTAATTWDMIRVG